MPNASRVCLRIVLSKFFPSICGNPNMEKSLTNSLVMRTAVWPGIGIASTHLVK